MHIRIRKIKKKKKKKKNGRVWGWAGGCIFEDVFISVLLFFFSTGMQKL